jgi:hypothetical protein
MKNQLSPVRRIALLAAGLVLAAGTAPGAQPDAVPPAAPAAPGQDALETCPYEQRSHFTNTVRQAAVRLDALIVPLTKRQKGGIAGGADAISLENLQTSRTELGQQLSKLEEVTPEDWADTRDAVLAALRQTQDAYEKAAKEYNQT